MKPVKKEKHTPKHYLPDTTPKIAAAGATVLVLLVALSFVLNLAILFFFKRLQASFQ